MPLLTPFQPLSFIQLMTTRYVLSFSAGGLLFHESIVVAEALLRASFDWQEALKEINEHNMLQSRTSSTATRKLVEVRPRLERLTDDQIRLLVSGSRTDQNLLIWLACCLRYQLLGDFAKEVLRGKFLELDLSIQNFDIERFFESKMLWHEELEELAPSTLAKLQTVLARMLRESGLVSKEGIIQSPIMSQDLVEVLRSDSNESFLYFPVATPE